MRIFFSLLRMLPPELAHSVALNALQLLYKLKLIKIFFPHRFSETSFTFKGLKFKNKLGIAAGLDKNGDFINSLGALGFGFIEVGTITPKPQFGNPKPRVFRFTNQEAIVNRLGFNNRGVDYLVKKLKGRKYNGVLGINIGANKDSTGQKRIDDYIECFQKVSAYADYITVNISSPNTPGLRSLHSKENFLPLFKAINHVRETENFFNPIFIKLSPDENSEVISEITKAIKEFNFDGVIASNTSIEKNNFIFQSKTDLSGGLSGKPLLEKSNELLSLVHLREPELLKIGVGGVHNKESFNMKLEKGASLVQIYTSFIYHGPKIINKLLN
ncbi:MAG: quinone-dependent dihydroorotate dehydrogenase [Candidatus Marinimicrobia bacterium]|jgi:dihydroorotate dehydrogenase|nr:quinone-dependent dihydroorotate dehydrogenase [Candidatus Neomarinimicrobiota bacterium]